MQEKSRILVVDDNEQFCQNVTDILELKDYEVVTASDGFKALELVKQNGFDLVLMDVKMPVMDGVETFKKVKEMTPDTPVIMVTAYAVEDLITEALREGAYGSLKKPLDFDQLLGLIEQATTANGELILVVDDDENLCANIKEVLSDKGYQVCVAYDGNTAIEKAKRNDFDVMLLDLKLPTLNGLQTYLSIRDFRPDVVAVIITGYSKEMSELIEQALHENIYTCLEKPISMDKLISSLERIEKQKAKGTLKKP
ncbi:Response regulator receiver protein [subsurface metagenome]